MGGFPQLNMSQQELEIFQRLSGRIDSRTRGSVCFYARKKELTSHKMHVKLF